MEYVVVWFVCGIISSVIGSNKGLGCGGFIAGLLLGPLGIILVLVLPGTRIKCQYCQKLIDKKAVKCPYCQSALNINIIIEEPLEDVVEEKVENQGTIEEPKHNVLFEALYFISKHPIALFIAIILIAIIIRFFVIN
jgi:hypothetical protein